MVAWFDGGNVHIEFHTNPQLGLRGAPTPPSHSAQGSSEASGSTTAPSSERFASAPQRRAPTAKVKASVAQIVVRLGAGASFKTPSGDEAATEGDSTTQFHQALRNFPLLEAVIVETTNLSDGNDLIHRLAATDDSGAAEGASKYTVSQRTCRQSRELALAAQAGASQAGSSGSEPQGPVSPFWTLDRCKGSWERC